MDASSAAETPMKVSFLHHPSKRTKNKRPRKEAAKTPSVERSWLPDYGRMIAEVFHKIGLGWVAVGQVLFSLHWLHFVVFPVGIYRLVDAWVTGFTGNPPVVHRVTTMAWFDRYVKVVSYPSPNFPNSTKTGLWWVPRLDMSTATKQGLSQKGLTHWEMMRMIMLFFPQLVVGSFVRCFQHKFGFGRWKPSKGDNHQTYLGIVNTSLGLYWNEAVGAFVYSDILLLANYNRGQFRYSKIEVYADHADAEITRVILYTAPDKMRTLKTEEIIVTDPCEIAIVVLQIGALGTHPQIHWWANGVAEVEQWKLRDVSSRWVNFLNLMSTFQSLFFYHAPFHNDVEILGQNIQIGVPYCADVPPEIQEWSTLYPMAAEARFRLRDHFEQERHPLKEQELQCLMAATMLHAADHHYMDKYVARNGLSKVLKSDFRAMRVGIVAGYRWIGTKFLCKQYLDDPVCRILYEVALKHDPEFAEGILSIGCSI